MPSLKCTQKLLKVIGVQPVAGVESSSPSALLGDWYANLLVTARQKVLLFTNEPTLYSFAVLGVRKPDLDRIAEVFVEHLRLNLAHEEIPAHVIARVVSAYRDMTITRTDNRSVLGSMNDLAEMLEHYVFDAGGPGACNILEINKQLNQSPHKPLAWKSSAEVLRERLLSEVSIPGRPIRRVFVN
ncbi:MAG: hypothetical protein NC910_04055 [Candidatus Omnitrophica bacterium]|nr:hypothetical protein [Candidatus Omnitrophota bacterium]